LSKALLVAILTATPLAMVDYVLATNLHLAPLYLLPVLIVAFAFCFLITSLELSVLWKPTSNSWRMLSLGA